MNRIYLLTAALVALALSGTTFAEEESAADIVKKVVAQYHDMKGYKAIGTVVADMDVNGMKTKSDVSFKMLLARPSLYKISWTTKQKLPGVNKAISQSGAVWHAAEKPYLFLDVKKAYAPLANDEIALAAATGASQGAANMLPSLFFEDSKQNALLRMTKPTLEKIETIRKIECYVISGPSAISAKESFWIAKERLLILQYVRDVEPPKNANLASDLKDEEIEQALKGMGKDPTEENKSQMKQMLEQQKAMMKNMKIKGSITETQSKITLPKNLEAKDFEFEVPADTKLEKSLF